MTLILPECIIGFSYSDCPAPESDRETFENICLTLQPLLSEADRMHIGYWNPKTVGHVIFHYWD